MWFLDQIVEYLAVARDAIYEAWQVVQGWWVPFRYLAPPLWGLYRALDRVVYGFYFFNLWIDNLASQLATIPTFPAIYAYFKTYFDYAVNAWNWIVNAWSNITAIVNNWWLSVQQTVLAWIEQAKQFLMTFIDQLNVWVANLQATWDNFWVNIFPTLLDKLTLNSILATWFKDFEPFWQGWQDWRDKVIEFFTDPLQWIYDRLEEWFERFW